ncbi:hypothetical protein Q8F55_008312 [Vanrija albida]|uniref:Uncharacterized protein n=1 Tax=Vanrija albida TaxID=181172 RepID=A0ABR3PWA0_9TREE
MAAVAPAHYYNALNSQRQGQPQRTLLIQPTVAPARDSSQVTRALNTTRALAEPGYARLILVTYVQAKRRAGKNTVQIGAKLRALERDFPQFASDFHHVRREYALDDSAELPAEEPGVCRCAAEEARRRHIAPPADRASQAARQLNTTRALADPGYAHAIIEKYVQTKLGGKKNKVQVNAKLLLLERDMPQFASEFYAVRARFGLGDSAVLPAPPARPSVVCRCGAGGASRSGSDEPAAALPAYHPPPAYPGHESSESD